MPVCETCGNDYDKAFQIVVQGKSHVFDSFECAIQALAPSCAHCGCKVIGHGVEADGKIFCCAHCAGSAGARGIKDRG
jgi:Rieske Fe-S protein